MANQSVLELAVGTGKWDAGLKKAKSALDNFTQANGGLQQALDKESQKMQQFVRMMGSMESTAKTAKGQMNDYKSTIEQLTMQYNRMSEAQKKVVGQDYLQTIDQLKQRYQSVNEEIQEMNRSLKNVEMPEMKSGGLFSGMGDKMSGALQVFAGNMMTKAAGAVANLGAEMYDMVQQGIEMAKQGEGIRIAFERLGRGDILQGLREATHGTVTDLELMKAAVKFNDFKLPVEELGTMLAFAQQKAKDTGQSVDYMVDSIVTGLGRKSLMILDNLGLSATEVKEKMAETGDMTKAVGEIIREQMAKAGDYVETAADRAAQANVSLQNKMEALGRKFAPVEEASNQLWTSMKIGILDIVGGPLATMLNQLTEAGRLKNALNDMNGDPSTEKPTKVQQQLSALRGSNYKNVKYRSQLSQYDKQIETYQTMIANGGKMPGAPAGSGKDVRWLQAQIEALKTMRSEYVAGAKDIMKPVEVKVKTDKAEQNVKTLVHTGTSGKAEIEAVSGSIDYQTQKVQELQKAWQAAADDDSRRKIKTELESAQAVLDNMSGKAFDTSKLKQIATTASIGPKMEMTDPLGTLNTMKQSVRLELKAEAVKVDEQTLQTLMRDAVQNGIDGMDFQFNSIGEKIGEGIDVPQSSWDAILTQYNALREQIGMEPIKINLETGSKEEDTDNKGDGNKNPYLHKNKDGKEEVKLNEVLSGVAHGMQGMVSGMEQLGIDIPSGIQDVLKGVDGVTQILTSIMSVITAIEAISAADAFVPFAHGGVVRAAAGWSGVVPGNSMSGDNVPALLNSGEVVLNHAQVSAVANELQSKDGGTGQRDSFITGEQIHIVHNRYLRRVGEGEIVTWKNT